MFRERQRKIGICLCTAFCGARPLDVLLAGTLSRNRLPNGRYICRPYSVCSVEPCMGRIYASRIQAAAAWNRLPNGASGRGPDQPLLPFGQFTFPRPTLAIQYIAKSQFFFLLRHYFAPISSKASRSSWDMERMLSSFSPEMASMRAALRDWSSRIFSSMVSLAMSL